MDRVDPRTAAFEVVAEHYGGAVVVFLAGSVTRGEATATSDLDLVVIAERLEAAYRESFVHGDWLVEAFVHDPETLQHFFLRDRARGVLQHMVASGIAIPRDNDWSRSLQALAEQSLLAGPPRWSEAEVDASRYAVTNLVDDLRSPRSRAELTATATQLYSALADHFLRGQGAWSGSGKAIPRRLATVAPGLAARFSTSFAELFETGRTAAVIDLAAEVLKPYGGWLFAGYKVVAPVEWRLASAPLLPTKGPRDP